MAYGLKVLSWKYICKNYSQVAIIRLKFCFVLTLRDMKRRRAVKGWIAVYGMNGHAAHKALLKGEAILGHLM
ncbi:hypothetical protein PGW94_03815 [Candidatus Anaplasma sp. TIGMIC]|nr:hypothetical protein [Candidatus Anaplasma sp. TIGMIC]